MMMIVVQALRVTLDLVCAMMLPFEPHSDFHGSAYSLLMLELLVAPV